MNFTSAINESKTREFTASEDLVALTAVELTSSGVAVTSENAVPVGILLNDALEGDDVTVQIDGGGLWLAGEAVSAGDLLSANEDGLAVKAAAGKFIFAQALEDANSNSAAQVQIIRAGKA